MSSSRGEGVVSKEAVEREGVEGWDSWSESSVSSSDEGRGVGGGAVGVSRRGRKVKFGFRRGVVGVVGAENNGDIEGTFKGTGWWGIVVVVEKAAGERDGTGVNSGGGDNGASITDADDVTALTEGWVSSKMGKRPMGTPWRYCAGCRRASGSGG